MAKKGELLAWTQEQIDFVVDNVIGTTNQDLADMVNAKFGTNKKFTAIRKLKFKMGLKSGIVHIPKYTEGKPLGSIRTKERRQYIKIDPNKWVQLHRYIWEQSNGPVPKGHVIIFGDGNYLNTNLDNLVLVSHQQLITMNERGLIKCDAELTRTGVLIADLVNKIGKRNIIPKFND